MNNNFPFFISGTHNNSHNRRKLPTNKLQQIIIYHDHQIAITTDELQNGKPRKGTNSNRW